MLTKETIYDDITLLTPQEKRCLQVLIKRGVTEWLLTPLGYQSVR